MKKKIPVFLCHTNILSGVTSWGFKMKKAFKDHPDYDVLLTHMWQNQNGDNFDLQFPNSFEAYKHFDSVGPSVIVPNYNWQLLRKVMGNGKNKFIGMCHSDSEPEYYLPLSHHESKFSKFIAVSPTCTEKLASWIPHRSSDIETLPYGIKIPENLQRTYQTQPIRLVYGGRVVQEQKRVFDFVPLVKHLVLLGVNFTFDIVGDGKDLLTLKNNFELEGLTRYVNCLGHVSQEKMPQIWREHDLFLQVSDFEGTSISMLESMAQGAVPVVTAASSGVENVIADGVNGKILPIGDMQGMAKAILDISRSENSLISMGEAAFQNSQQFSLESYVDSYSSILDKVCASFKPKTFSMYNGFHSQAATPKSKIQNLQSSKEQTLAICTTPRSGSNWLCDLLNSSEKAGKPWEYFYLEDLQRRLSILFQGKRREYFDGVDPEDIKNYVGAVNKASKTSNNVASFKIMPAHFQALLEKLHAQVVPPNLEKCSDKEALDMVFPNLKFIWLTRRNKYKQAISYLKAHQSNVWFAKENSNNDTKFNPTYNYDHISMLAKSLTSQEAVWADFFSNSEIEPLVLVYEDMISHPTETMQAIFNYLEQPVPEKLASLKSRSKKLSNSISEDWYSRYIAENNELERNWWAAFKEAKSQNNSSITQVDTSQTEQPRSNPKNEIIQKGEWTNLPLTPREITPTKSMITGEEVQYIYWLINTQFTGSGTIVDLGSLQGSSTAAMGKGLQENRKVFSHEHTIYAYDLFEYQDYMQNIFPNSILEPGDSLIPIFKKNTASYQGNIQMIAGDILNEIWHGIPIEILFVDLSKSWDLNQHVIQEFFPALIAGESIVVHQDYFWPGPHWIHITMEYLSDYFDPIHAMQRNSLGFKYIKQIPRELLQTNLKTDLSDDEKIRLMDQAISKHSGHHKSMLMLTKVGLLIELQQFSAAESLINHVKASEYASLPQIQTGLKKIKPFDQNPQINSQPNSTSNSFVKLDYQHLEAFYKSNKLPKIGSTSFKDIRFIWSMIEKEQPKTYLELGVASGFSTAMTLEALESLGSDRTLIGVDLFPKFYLDRDQDTGYLVNEIKSEIKCNYELHLEKWSADFETILNGRNVDVAFIDAAHTHPWTLLDFILVLPFMNKGGIVIFHDINLYESPRWAHCIGPHHVFDSFPGEKLPVTYKNIGAIRHSGSLSSYEDAFLKMLSRTWTLNRPIQSEFIDKILQVVKRYYSSNFYEQFEALIAENNIKVDQTSELFV